MCPAQVSQRTWLSIMSQGTSSLTFQHSSSVRLLVNIWNFQYPTEHFIKHISNYVLYCQYIWDWTSIHAFWQVDEGTRVFIRVMLLANILLPAKHHATAKLSVWGRGGSSKHRSFKRLRISCAVRQHIQKRVVCSFWLGHFKNVLNANPRASESL